MAYTLPGVVVLLQILTGSLVTGVSVVVNPSPIAMVTEGAVLWLTCTYDLGGGTLGQLLWKDKDSANAATATPTATPPCSAPSMSYNISCNLASNDVRLCILAPVHGNTYSCLVYLSNYTQIGSASTQVSVITQTLSLSVTPSSPILKHELTLTCSVSMDIIENMQIFYKRNTFLVGMFLVNSTLVSLQKHKEVKITHSHVGFFLSENFCLLFLLHTSQGMNKEQIGFVIYF
ncbi:uncharacterized protein LOC110441087 [Mizuhopecten yessoensis]|uniref:uncharacterized protein LOC110441087 n=1 Tax=Mizuhopecten yessoensis TaxID=6573 RepID=UPI000B45A788|nr:uncharacterized protein LOC110441087 [Mizuhopecten yessoensis]